jgi:hypothetical protein
MKNMCYLHRNGFLVFGTAFIPGTEWILVHGHFTCNSQNLRILAPLIYFEQNLNTKVVE